MAAPGMESFQLSAFISQFSNMSMTDAKALRTQAHPLGGGFADRSAAQYRKPSRANLSAGERDHWHILLPKRGEPSILRKTPCPYRTPADTPNHRTCNCAPACKLQNPIQLPAHSQSCRPRRGNGGEQEREFWLDCLSEASFEPAAPAHRN